MKGFIDSFACSCSHVRSMFILLSALWLSVSVRGGNLHTIIFADTNDPKIGASVLQDYYNLSVEASTIAAATGLHMKSYYFKGNQCSNANLVTLLDELHTEKDDVILFYYTGHGTRAKDDKSEFPQMCLGSLYDDDFYPLEQVLKQLNRQPARLKIVIGDCCNSVVPGVTAKDYETRSVTVLTREPVNLYNSLFMGNEGYLISSASRKGENAVGTQDGGYYTVSILNVLKDIAAKGMLSTWENIMLKAKNLTYQYGKHTPVYSVKIVEESDEASEEEAPQAEAPAPENYQEPQNTSVADSAQPEKIDKIDLLTAIGNEGLSVEERVRLQEKALNAIFSSPNTKVEIVGSNGTTIVATEKASDFVLHLCTAHKLVGLAEVDFTADESGKYSYLKVHEIYKK